MKACLYEMPSDHVIVDIPSGQFEMISGLIRMGFDETFVVARMFNGKTPKVRATLKAVASMELG